MSCVLKVRVRQSTQNCPLVTTQSKQAKVISGCYFKHVNLFTSRDKWPLGDSGFVDSFDTDNTPGRRPLAGQVRRQKRERLLLNRLRKRAARRNQMMIQFETDFLCGEYLIIFWKL